jgi:hypothetical protein
MISFNWLLVSAEYPKPTKQGQLSGERVHQDLGASEGQLNVNCMPYTSHEHKEKPV